MNYKALYEALEFSETAGAVNLFGRLAGLTALAPSAQLKNRSAQDETANTVRFCQILGYDKPMVQALSSHQQRFNSWLSTASTTYLVLSASFALLLLVGIVYLSARAIGPLGFDVNLLRVMALGVVAAGILFTVVAAIASRFAFVLTSTSYAETLCAMTVVRVIVDLSRDDVLIRSDSRKRLLVRLNYLARVTLLLASFYKSNDKTNQVWLTKHFEQMGAYIRERERWIIAPTATTLEDLRKDFYQLSIIYITGNYGAFSWPKEAIAGPESLSLTWSKRVLIGLPRFVGIVLPVILIVLLQQQQPNQKVLGVLEPNVAILLLIAWILLTIDAILRLGIVANLVAIAKGIRDLK